MAWGARAAPMRSAMRSRSSTAAFRLNVEHQDACGIGAPRDPRGDGLDECGRLAGSGTRENEQRARPRGQPPCAALRQDEGDPPGPARCAPAGTHRGSPGAPGGATGAWWRKRSSRGSPVLVVCWLAGRRASEGGGRGVRGKRAARRYAGGRSRKQGLRLLPSAPRAVPLASRTYGMPRGGAAVPPYGRQVSRAGTGRRQLSGRLARVRRRPIAPVSCRRAADGRRRTGSASFRGVPSER